MPASHSEHLDTDMLRDAKSPGASSSSALTGAHEATKRQDTAWQEGHATLPIPPIDGENPQHINRELSWLAFNERVLAEANNPNHPLLERLRFVAISADNLDEFFMVRVAGLKHASARDDTHKMLIDKQLHAMDYRIRHLMRQQQTILPELWQLLGREKIHLVSPLSLTQADRDYISQYIEEEVIHVITPQALDPAHPFPFIANRGFGMFLEVANKKGKTRQALIMLPSVLKRFIRLQPSKGEGEAARFITLEEAILLNLEMIFPRHHLVHHVFFRLLRDSEIDYDEEAEDLVATFENALRARRRGNVIALHLSAEASDSFTSALINELAVGAHDIHFVGGMIGLADLTQLCGAGEDGLRFPSYTPRFPERIRDYGGDCFAAIRAKDIVVHHPYESFDVVLQFLRQAAEDPQVISIRQTLYRTLPDSPIVRALILAAEAGKSVMAMVEIKARFDEEVNIRLARDLERAGVQVVYGFTKLKTHAKLSLVVRQEEGKLRTYAHCGTGNYHPVNARIYTDLSFFTCESQVCSDIVRIFNYMTSYVKPSKLHKVKFSPVSGRDMFEVAIQ
ncbi:MAG: polyphosphate kinase 1, partial [Proteobacteria bacterium]|nr:polyphosphate kinase 1 [Pseudomonadota bacterium]